MTHSKSAREWWIRQYGKTNVLPQNRSSYAYDKEQMDYHAGYAEESRSEFYKDHTHVIEHSAYLREKQHATVLFKQNEEIREERDRYRGALEKIANRPCSYDHAAMSIWMDDVEVIARQALSPNILLTGKKQETPDGKI